MASTRSSPTQWKLKEEKGRKGRNDGPGWIELLKSQANNKAIESPGIDPVCLQKDTGWGQQEGTLQRTASSPTRARICPAY